MVVSIETISLKCFTIDEKMKIHVNEITCYVEELKTSYIQWPMTYQENDPSPSSHRPYRTHGRLS